MQEDVPTRPANHSPDDHADPGQTLWLVSYAEDDDREMTAEQIFQAMRRGEIDGETIVWRDGMPEWQAIVDVDTLQRAIGMLAGGGSVDKKRTVMGGFHAAPPAPRRSPVPTPTFPSQTPIPAVAAKPKLSRSTLIGGAHAGGVGRNLQHAAPAPPQATPDISDLDDTNELDAQLLESVRSGPPDEPLKFPDLPSTAATAPLPDAMLAYHQLPSDPDSAPISLDPDSIESLPSNALESVVAQLPNAAPGAPANIFRVSSAPPDAIPEPETLTKPVEPKVRPRPPMRDRSVVPQPAVESSSSHPPAPVAQPERRRGGAGRIVAILLALGAIGGAMFYLGRETAKPIGAEGEPTATAATGAAIPEATTSQPSATAPSSAAAEPEPEPEPEETAAKTEEQPAPKKAVLPVARPRPRSVPTPSPSPRPDPAPAPKPDEKAASDAPGPFNTTAASAALTAAAGSASSCRKEGDPSGVANVTVTFSPSGRAINANVQGPPFAGTVTGGCIASRMRSAKVPPFSGDRITVKKVVVIQ